MHETEQNTQANLPCFDFLHFLRAHTFHLCSADRISSAIDKAQNASSSARSLVLSRPPSLPFFLLFCSGFLLHCVGHGNIAVFHGSPSRDYKQRGGRPVYKVQNSISTQSRKVGQKIQDNRTSSVLTLE